RGDPAVTLQGDRGTFRINRAAAETFGNPKAVELLFDRDSQRVGFRPVDPRAPTAARLSPHKAGSYQEGGAKSFCGYYGIPLGRTLPSPANVEEGVLVIELRAAVPSAGPGRRPREGASSAEPPSTPAADLTAQAAGRNGG